MVLFSADNNNIAWFIFQANIAGIIGNDSKKDVKIIVLLKYLSSFWRILEIPLINC